MAKIKTWILLVLKAIGVPVPYPLESVAPWPAPESIGWKEQRAVVRGKAPRLDRRRCVVEQVSPSSGEQGFSTNSVDQQVAVRGRLSVYVWKANGSVWGESKEPFRSEAYTRLRGEE